MAPQCYEYACGEPFEHYTQCPSQAIHMSEAQKIMRTIRSWRAQDGLKRCRGFLRSICSTKGLNITVCQSIRPSLKSHTRFLQGSPHPQPLCYLHALHSWCRSAAQTNQSSSSVPPPTPIQTLRHLTASALTIRFLSSSAPLNRLTTLARHGTRLSAFRPRGVPLAAAAGKVPNVFNAAARRDGVLDAPPGFNATATSSRRLISAPTCSATAYWSSSTARERVANALALTSGVPEESVPWSTSSSARL